MGKALMARRGGVQPTAQVCCETSRDAVSWRMPWWLPCQWEPGSGARTKEETKTWKVLACQRSQVEGGGGVRGTARGTTWCWLPGRNTHH